MAKILVIEDDQAIAELEKDYLEANSFTVDTAFDGESGLKKALENKYDLILLDIKSPASAESLIIKIHPLFKLHPFYLAKTSLFF
jgi:DNA-binding response OmpR family regulator